MNSPDANRIIRWGILGTARIATKVGQALHFARGSQLAGVASRDLERAQRWVSSHSTGPAGTHSDVAVSQRFLSAGTQVAAYGCYRELLDDPEIDAVYIPLPPALHCEWTCRAAEHGKHVLCEKPLAMSHAEGRRMAEACQAHNRQLMDGVMWYHHDRTAAMRGVLNSGALGPLRHVSSAFSFPGLIDMQPDNIRFQRELGGGVLGDVGWYCVAATLWAFDGALPERVVATERRERGVDVSLSALLTFEGGRSASFQCGFDAVWRKWMEVAGTSGSIVCDDFVNPWDPAKARFWVHDRQGQSTAQHFPHCVQEIRMVEAMCDIIRSGRLDPHWPEISLATQRVCDAIAASARDQRFVTLS